MEEEGEEMDLGIGRGGNPSTRVLGERSEVSGRRRDRVAESEE